MIGIQNKVVFMIGIQNKYNLDKVHFSNKSQQKGPKSNLVCVDNLILCL